MPNYRGTIPKIVWGDAYDKTCTFGYPLDEAIADAGVREGSAFVQGASGVEDAWILGDDQTLEATARWIPRDATTAPVATGWDDANGVRDMLSWARKKNVLRFYPDLTLGTYVSCYLVEPTSGGISLEEDMTRRLRLKLRTTDGTVFAGY